MDTTRRGFTLALAALAASLCGVGRGVGRSARAAARCLDLAAAPIAAPAGWEAAFVARWGPVGPLDRERIDAIVHASGGVYDDTDGPLAWIAHYWVRAFVAMASLTGEARFMAAARSLVLYMLDNTDERRIARGEIAENYLRDPGGLAGTGTGGPLWKRGRNADVLDTGQVTHAILVFCDAVLSAPARWPDFTADAARALDEARRAVDLFDHDWLAGGEAGSWAYRDSEGSGALGATRIAFNQAASMGSALLILHRHDASPARADKIRRLAQTWLDDYARPRTDGTIAWPYIVHPDETAIEDVVHASVDLDFLVAAEASGLTALDASHMRSLARTFLTSVFDGRDGIARNVDGTGGPAEDEHWACGHGWLALAAHDPQIASAVLAVYAARFGPDTAPGTLWSRPMLGWANLLTLGAGC